MAYADARIDPRTQIDSFVCCSEDFDEGTSIFDEYVPDQLGAVQRPVQTVAGDGLFGLATGAMLIRSGIASVVAVEAHSKASDVVSQGRIDRFALDPVLNRPLGVAAMAVAGLEMRRCLHELGLTADTCSELAADNRINARDNPRASFADRPADRTPLFDPLTADQVAPSADGCIVLVLADDERAGERGVVLDAIDWRQDAPSIESRRWGWCSASLELAAASAWTRASVVPGDLDVVEVDDRYAHRQLAAVRVCDAAELPSERVNPSGGALGEGYLHEAHGLARTLSCVERIRSGDADVALACVTRDVPSTGSCVAIFRGQG